MLVCHCHQVCDRTIRACIRDGANSVAAVGESCGAGTGCGGCRPTISELVAERTEAPRRSLIELVVRLPLPQAG
ncbi:MAG TPA: (2Fe-2S)-binding protein [Polyangia bacterium]|nr:(2Fe-2S)-binding protein [Polyangia bacterium]